MSEGRESEIKQVLVMRTDLNMRKGKMIAQGGHACQGFLFNKFNLQKNEEQSIEISFSKEEVEWILYSHKKICTRVNSEEELHKIYNDAISKGLKTYLVLDSGMTEFHGVPTYTCLAIGPNDAHKIDEVTGHLELL